MPIQILVATKRIHTDPDAMLILDQLESHLLEDVTADSILYYDFPVFEDYAEARHRCSLLLVTRTRGVIAIGTRSLVSTNPGESAEDLISSIYSLLFSKFLRSPVLRASPASVYVPITTVQFDSSPEPHESETSVPLFSGISQLANHINSLKAVELSLQQLNETRAIIEGTKALTRGLSRTPRTAAPTTKPEILDFLDREIATFDVGQRRAAISLVQGPQRIRGLAGSGKTVVLAMKAAQLHLDNADSNILVTFHTKSLYQHIRALIRLFYKQFSDAEPDWDKLHVMHAWGGKKLTGVYSLACDLSRRNPMRLSDVPAKVQDKLGYVCQTLIDQSDVPEVFDCVLIDEAQDFGPSFFRLCYLLTKGERDEKNIVWAYDELQSILDVRQRSPVDLFGVDEDGEPLVDLSRASKHHRFQSFMTNDIVLHKCYRNSRSVLVSAHALGFALYADTPVQILENQSHWEDVGYEVLSGDFKEGSKMVLHRPEENSPLSISRFLNEVDILRCSVAPSFGEEIIGIVAEVQSFVESKIKPEDILIINLDDRQNQNFIRELSLQLTQIGIESHNTSSKGGEEPDFRVPGKVMLSTVYSAKGNESPVVFVSGIDALFEDRGLRTARNKLFTAMTRAKVWLRISGVGDRALFFIRELQEAMRHIPNLVFNYPDPQVVETVQRDLSERSKKIRMVLDQIESLGVSSEELKLLMDQTDRS